MSKSAYRRVSFLPLSLMFFFLGVLTTPSGAQPFTVASVLSAPFPTALTASPKGNLIAWVFNDQGKRNIWVAAAPDFKPRILTRFEEDDGQELGRLAFNADGTIIVFVRGDSANTAGEYPNPRSDAAGTEQAVWAVNVNGGEPWRVGEGSNPVASPVGNQVVFLLRGRIFIASLDPAPQPKLLFRARGSNSQPSWSPDGKKLAFVSSREDHSFIGIYDLEAKKIRWIAPSVDRDTSPVFSPDGRRIAFIRFPGSLGTSFFTEGQTFSIMVADLETGWAREIWKCPDETGGFAQTYPARALMWAAENRLVFYSEHEGWMHLYSAEAETGKTVCLTPGEYEVEDCGLSPDGSVLYFNSNSGDIDRRHIWSVPVKGGVAEVLTSGMGIEWAPVCMGDGQNLAFLCSTALQPAAPAVMNLKSKERRLIAPESIPAGFPSKALVVPQQVIFQAPDGLNIHCQLFLPRGAKPGDSRPAVIFMHGGPIRQMILGWHMRGYYHNCYAFNQYLANKGYVVLSVNFRSGIGYGRAFRTAPNQGPRGASEYKDIVAAGKYLQNRPEVNPSKIGLWGGSYGGYLTALGLARDSELFAAGVDLHGVHDWALRGRRRDGGGWGIQGDELMRTAYDSSPVADVAFWTSPVLFIHGDDDRNVEFLQTTDLVQQLRKLGKAHVEVLVFPDEVHSFLLHERWVEAFKAAADFFDRFLKKNE